MRKDFEELVCLYGIEERVLIYQLKNDTGCSDYAFRSYNYLKANGLKVKRENYNFVYSEPLKEQVSLESIYERFSAGRTNDYKGNPLSVSDIIVIRRNGKNKAYYVDSIGFTELNDIFAEEDKGVFLIAGWYVKLYMSGIAYNNQKCYDYRILKNDLGFQQAGSVYAGKREFVGVFCEIFDKMKEDDVLYANVTEETEFAILDYAEFVERISN